MPRPCFHSHPLVLMQVKNKLSTLCCGRSASYTMWQECMKPVLTLMGQTSLQSLYTGTDVYIPLHACRKTKCIVCTIKLRLLQTLTLAPNNPQSPKPHPPPTAGAQKHTHTHTYMFVEPFSPVRAPCQLLSHHPKCLTYSYRNKNLKKKYSIKAAGFGKLL